jgi:hypothetical protein
MLEDPMETFLDWTFIAGQILGFEFLFYGFFLSIFGSIGNDPVTTSRITAKSATTHWWPNEYC